jgi:hypothetical protein
MPIERYKVGKPYNQRYYLSVSGDDLHTKEGVAALLENAEQMQQVGDAMAALGNPWWRLESSIRCARATLQKAGLPLEPNAGIYLDRTWQRKNERRTPPWYAIMVLHEYESLRIFVEQGDVERAADCALDLGELITEAKFMFQILAKNAAKGGQAKQSSKRREIEQKSEAWRTQAAEIWSRHPRWTIINVARKIDRVRFHRVRSVIASLKPVRK